MFPARQEMLSKHFMRCNPIREITRLGHDVNIRNVLQVLRKMKQCTSVCGNIIKEQKSTRNRS